MGNRANVLKFAHNKGYDDIEYVCSFGKYFVYYPIASDNALLFPCFILSNGDDIRLSTICETEAIMDYLDDVEDL